VSYSPYYPGGWKNLPDRTTPERAEALQNMETGITANDAAVTELTTGGPGSLVVKAAKLPDLSGTYALVAEPLAVAAQATANAAIVNLTPTATKTTTYTAAAQDLVLTDATSGAFAVTLPTAPADKTMVEVKKIDSSANAVTITCGGSDTFTVGGTTLALAVQGHAATVRYQASTSKWITVSNDVPLTQSDLRYALIPRTTAKKAVAQDELMINVKDYGAVGNGTTDDTTAIQNAVNAATAGGTVLFPVGYYKITSAITVTQPICLQGTVAGKDGSGIGSGIMSTSGTNAFTCSSDRVSFRDLMFLANTYEGATISSRTWAIKFTTGDSCSVIRCRFQYYYYGIWFANCQLWTVDDNLFHNNSGYGLLIQNVALPDAGDQNLTKNTFQAGTAVTGTWSSGGLIGATTMTLASNPGISVGSTIVGTGIPANTSVTAVAGSVITFDNAVTGSNAAGTYTFDNWAGLAQVRQESGGGTKVVGNKFLGGPIGYQVAPTDGAGTSILPMTGNSFELHTFANIHLTAGTGGAGTGTFRRIVITGNQFTSTLVAQAALYCDTTNNQFNEVMFSNNILVGTTASTQFVRLSNVNGITITGNYFNTGLTAVFCYGGSSNVLLTPNNCVGITGTLYRWDGQTSGASSRPVLIEKTANFLVTSTSTYTQVIQVVFNAIGSTNLEVFVVGNLSGGGALSGYFKRLAVLNTVGTVPVLTTIGTDTTGAIPFDFLFDVATNNTVFVKIRRNAGDGGAQIQGAIIVRAFGSQQLIG
jgi:Cu/Ag efflux protein CusF